MTLVPTRGAEAARVSSATGADDAWQRDWAPLSRCADQDPDALFVEGKEQRVAKIVCRGCPVVAECLAAALDTRTQFGVWGGMTERERRALLRAHPPVTSWAALLQAMRAEGRGPIRSPADVAERLSRPS